MCFPVQAQYNIVTIDQYLYIYIFYSHFALLTVKLPGMQQKYWNFLLNYSNGCIFFTYIWCIDISILRLDLVDTR